MRKSIPIDKIKEIPKKPGIYFLKNENGDVFYVGKSTNIRGRVQSHKNNTDSFRLPEKISAVEWIETANEIEALIKESEYIKKYKPKMNVRLLDDKRYFYVGITKTEFPRIFTTHQPVGTEKENAKIEYIGPFTDGASLKTTMKYLRKTFPYYATSTKSAKNPRPHPKLPCSWCHLDLCPGPDAEKKEYRKNIRAIKDVLTGKKSTVLKKLKTEMKKAAGNKEFEKAAHLRDTIESLENIFSHYNIASPWKHEQEAFSSSSASIYLEKLLEKDMPIKTIEGYDVSNIQGNDATASMVRFENGMPNKSLYRKFNIHAPNYPNDYLMMREVIKRRFKHEEWPYPDMILIDGGRGQLNAAVEELNNINLPIPVISLAKKLEEVYIPGKQKPILLSETTEDVERLLKHVRDEAHRFAISHHRKRRGQRFRK